MIQSRLPRTLLHVESELKPARSIRKREKWEGETGILGPCMDVLSPWLNVWLNGWLECIPSTQQRGWFNKYLLKEKVRRRVREGEERERLSDRQTDGQDLPLLGLIPSLKDAPGCQAGEEEKQLARAYAPEERRGSAQASTLSFANGRHFSATLWLLPNGAPGFILEACCW